MIKKIIEDVCYYGYSPEVYKSVKKDISISNRKFAHGFCLITIFMVIAAYLSDAFYVSIGKPLRCTVPLRKMTFCI